MVAWPILTSKLPATAGPIKLSSLFLRELLIYDPWGTPVGCVSLQVSLLLVLGMLMVQEPVEPPVESGSKNFSCISFLKLYSWSFLYFLPTSFFHLNHTHRVSQMFSLGGLGWSPIIDMGWNFSNNPLSSSYNVKPSHRLWKHLPEWIPLIEELMPGF